MIPHLTKNDDSGAIAAALEEAGAVVIHDLVDQPARAALMDELEGALGQVAVAESDEPEDFYTANTKRLTALIARSKIARGMALDPAALALCDATLLPNCERYQLHVATALVIGPGAREQVLHREDDVYPFFSVPRPNLVLATMRALTPFTAENGATLIVPGSHRWDSDRSPEAGEVVSAEMPAGAMLVWLGGTLHAAGENRSWDWRHGVFISYSLGWLRQEENQYLDIPWSVAQELSSELRHLTGFGMHGGLGFYDPSLPGR